MILKKSWGPGGLGPQGSPGSASDFKHQYQSSFPMMEFHPETENLEVYLRGRQKDTLGVCPIKNCSAPFRWGQGSTDKHADAQTSQSHSRNEPQKKIKFQFFNFKCSCFSLSCVYLILFGEFGNCQQLLCAKTR